MSDKLGFMYRKYLRGSDLTKPVTVEILSFGVVQVQPHPTAPAQAKWCMFVRPFDKFLPNAILIGPKMEEDLVSLFGNVELETLKGKQLTIYPSAYNIGGIKRVGIRIRKASLLGSTEGQAQPAAPKEAVPPEPPEPPDEPEIPF
jgi:hypothetical protein